MSVYKLTKYAEKDLEEIADYTLTKWGGRVFDQYRNGLKNTFKLIAKQQVIKKTFSKSLPDVYVAKYKYHFIFYVYIHNDVIILGVIHEQRDILHNLTHRLE